MWNVGDRLVVIRHEGLQGAELSIGDEVIVVESDWYGNGSRCRVKDRNGTLWVCSNSAFSPQFHSGDRVQVRQGVEPTYSWGDLAQNRRSIGIVYQVDPLGIIVNFPEQSNWIAGASELEFAQPAQPAQPAHDVIQISFNEHASGLPTSTPSWVCERCGLEVEGLDLTEVIYPRNAQRGINIVQNWCSNCLDSYAGTCEACGRTLELNHICTDGCGTTYCQTCSQDRVICERCGTWTNDWDDNNYCPDCHEPEPDVDIHEYHDHNVNIRPLPDSHSSLYYGVELETDDYDDRAGAADDLNDLSQDESLFHLAEDCSLNNGFEIITQPCTLDYHRTQFPWDEIRKVVRRYGGSSERTSHAALHVHFSRQYYEGRHQYLYELRLVYLFEKFWKQLVHLGRTSEYLLSRSCMKYIPYQCGGQVHTPNDLLTHRSRHVNRMLKENSYRYMAVNLHSSQPTIEIRLFRGTLSRVVILASIELVDFLVRLAKRTSNSTLRQLTWPQVERRIELSGYEYLPAYIESRKLTIQEED